MGRLRLYIYAEKIAHFFSTKELITQIVCNNVVERGPLVGQNAH